MDMMHRRIIGRLQQCFFFSFFSGASNRDTQLDDQLVSHVSIT